MACNYNVVAFAIAAIILPTMAMATDYVVGDDNGWKPDFNYTTWATGKVFYVGDTIVFKYSPPHNVIKVNGTNFKDCKPTGVLLSTGNDAVTLASSGKKWYLCGVEGHCARGQKLVINVEATAPAPAPISAAYALHTVSSYHQIFVAALVLFAVFLV